MAHRLLISAHDPGAAQALAPVLRHALADHRFDVAAVADGPGFSALRAYDLPVRHASVGRVESAAGERLARLLDSAGRILDDERPAAVLTGCSGPDAGLDEALARQADGRCAVFTLQDFWGDVNPILPPRGTFLVADRRAADLTRARGIDRVVPVGMPGYADDAPPPGRESARAELGIPDARTVVVWFGQPLWHVRGYRATIEAVGRGLATMPGPIRCIYRPHPRESEHEHGLARHALGVGGVAVEPRPADDLRCLLAAVDVAASAWSTIGVTLAHMLRRSRGALGTPMFVLTAPELRRYYEGYTGLATVPLADAGAAVSVDDAAVLGEALLDAASTGGRMRVRAAAAAEVPDPAQAVERVLETIAESMRPGSLG